MRFANTSLGAQALESGSVPSQERAPAPGGARLSGIPWRWPRFILWAVLAALPGSAWASGHCASASVTAETIRDRADIRAFVECAHAYVMENGTEEAARAFREDEAWRSGSIYVFVDQQGASGSEATSYVFPPDPSREGQPWGPLVDEFGTDYFAETTRLLGVLGGSARDGTAGPAAGWMYYSFTNPATGRSEPKASYIIALDWDGNDAMIGAGIYQPDIPATCYPEQVNALQLNTEADDGMLAEFVRCAAMVVERKGFFGVAELQTERWRSGSVYVFGVDARTGVQLFTSNPARVNGRSLMEGLDDRDPTGRFAGRDVAAVGSSFGEAYLYYEGFNPASGAAQGKVTFVKRVMAQGTPVLVGSGYYLGAAAGALPPSGGSGEPTLAAGATWTNALGMEFVGVPAGSFVMGSPEDEEGRSSDERQREVRISQGFWMGKYEVTQGEWEAVMGTNPSGFPECGARCPVEQVSWDDVQEFIRRLNERESASGYVYRLPTEAEWEYAARAGTTGARHGELDEVAWYSDNSGPTTHPVGEKQANAWGLHDTLGNVWEFVADWYGEYPAGAVTDPQGPDTGSGRVIRGGSWGGGAGYVRSAVRFSRSPGHRDGFIGFRLVRTE